MTARINNWNWKNGYKILLFYFMNTQIPATHWSISATFQIFSGMKKLNLFCIQHFMERPSNIMSVSPVDSSNSQLASLSTNPTRRKPLSISSNINLEDIIMTTCTTLLPSQLEIDRTYLLYSNVTELGLSTRGEKMKLEKIEYILSELRIIIKLLII